MLKYFLFVLAAIGAYGKTTIDTYTRVALEIVGQQTIKSVVRIYDTEYMGKNPCGGVLISHTWAITTTNCVNEKTDKDSLRLTTIKGYEYYDYRVKDIITYIEPENEYPNEPISEIRFVTLLKLYHLGQAMEENPIEIRLKPLLREETVVLHFTSDRNQLIELFYNEFTGNKFALATVRGTEMSFEDDFLAVRIKSEYSSVLKNSSKVCTTYFSAAFDVDNKLVGLATPDKFSEVSCTDDKYFKYARFTDLVKQRKWIYKHIEATDLPVIDYDTRTALENVGSQTIRSAVRIYNIKNLDPNPCGGFLISSGWVITTTRCVDKKTDKDSLRLKTYDSWDSHDYRVKDIIEPEDDYSNQFIYESHSIILLKLYNSNMTEKPTEIRLKPFLRDETVVLHFTSDRNRLTDEKFYNQNQEIKFTLANVREMDYAKNLLEVHIEKKEPPKVCTTDWSAAFDLDGNLVGLGGPHLTKEYCTDDEYKPFDYPRFTNLSKLRKLIYKHIKSDYEI